MSDDRIDWGWFRALTGLTPPPIEGQPLAPPSQEADCGVSLALEPVPGLNEDWQTLVQPLDSTSFSNLSDSAADSAFFSMEHDALWGQLLAPSLDLFAPDANIAGGQDWMNQLLVQNPVPEEALSLNWPDQPNTAFGLEETTRKRPAGQEGDSATEPSAVKRPRLDQPWSEGPTIDNQLMPGPFGDVHIEAPALQEPILLGDEEWLYEEHVDAGM